MPLNWHNPLKKHLIIASVLVLISMLLRFLLLDIPSNDYLVFLSPWYEHIQTKGGLSSLLTLQADYNLPYQYAMVLMTKLPIDKLHAIKLFSILFDYLLVFYTYKIVLHISKDRIKSLYGAVAIAFLPTTIINSAGWGQSDVIFTSLLVVTLYYIMQDKPIWAMLAYSMSFGFKIQAIFLGPIMLILLLKGFFKLKHLLIPVFVYIALSIPVVMVGGSWTRIVDIAASQINIRDGFSFFLPNFYYLFQANSALAYLSWKNTFILLFIVGCLLLTFLAFNKMNIKNNYSLLKWSLVFSLFVPYFLVRMHERYYFTASCLALILFFVNKKRYLFPLIIIELVSLVAYYTVSWWHVNQASVTRALWITQYLYPWMSLSVLWVIYKTIKSEIKGDSPCCIEPIN